MTLTLLIRAAMHPCRFSFGMWRTRTTYFFAPLSRAALIPTLTLRVQGGASCLTAKRGLLQQNNVLVLSQVQ
ncbi:hypothetical protein H6F87_26135 [Cyanobacteria bacterium FACHB-502]|nr:hypothetical protein [Cyanobacteria bacterium FACHB-502]